jgi:hypothetical protein
MSPDIAMERNEVILLCSAFHCYVNAGALLFIAFSALTVGNITESKDIC